MIRSWRSFAADNVVYARAARLVEIMEARGLVGPQDGVKPREILLQKETLDAFFAGHQDGDMGQ